MDDSGGELRICSEGTSSLFLSQKHLMCVDFASQLYRENARAMIQALYRIQQGLNNSLLPNELRGEDKMNTNETFLIMLSIALFTIAWMVIALTYVWAYEQPYVCEPSKPTVILI